MTDIVRVPAIASLIVFVLGDLSFSWVVLIAIGLGSAWLVALALEIVRSIAKD